jgi:hypothetical protein
LSFASTIFTPEDVQMTLKSVENLSRLTVAPAIAGINKLKSTTSDKNVEVNLDEKNIFENMLTF